MYTCREVGRLLDIYADGELDEPRRLRIDAHLRDCASCSRLVSQAAAEARLIRSSDPVPALSASFTGQVMSNLTRSNSRNQSEGFFSLRRALARPWLSPVLAGLLLLATVSWAASQHLLPVTPGPGAFRNSIAAGPAAPAMRQNSTSSGNDSKPGLGQAGGNVRGEAQGSASVEGSGSEQAIRPESGGIGPATPNLSPGSGASSVTSALPGSPAPATSYEELQQQGYAVWQPGYLPAGYSLASYSTQPSGLAAGDITAKNGLLITYRNNQTGGWITLEIQPQHSSLPVAAPAAPYAATEAAAPPAAQPAPAGSASANTTANQPPGITASVNPTVVQQPGAGQITRSAIENGSVFTLTVSGSLSGQELQKVADSVQ